MFGNAKKIDELNLQIKKLQEENIVLKEENKWLNQTQKEHELMLNLLTYNYIIIGVERNKNEELVFVCKHQQSGGTFHLYLIGVGYSVPYPRLLSVDRSFPDRTIHIQDFLAEKKSVGHGNILLKYYEAIAKSEGFSKITGNLTADDMESTPYLVDFYKKNGFQVELYENDRSGGSIKKELILKDKGFM
ncbi:hypothetical protein [Falsibacillus pallidus]|uniref:hypothetical protein n=1 Tax=Falsibacillus pallidus TaxID=493781 RepID=UPI003D97F907